MSKKKAKPTTDDFKFYVLDVDQVGEMTLERFRRAHYKARLIQDPDIDLETISKLVTNSPQFHEEVT